MSRTSLDEHVEDYTNITIVPWKGNSTMNTITTPKHVKTADEIEATPVCFTTRDHAAPTIVVEIHRYTEPDKFGFITLTPTEEAWNIFPLGKTQPRYQRDAQLHSEDQACELRDDMADWDYYTWFEMPDYLRYHLIGAEVPLEWKSGLLGNHPSVIGRVSVWVNGILPTETVEVSA